MLDDCVENIGNHLQQNKPKTTVFFLSVSVLYFMCTVPVSSIIDITACERINFYSHTFM